jgi:DNA polymerase-1
MPEELVPQFPVIKEILEAMGIAIFEMEGYEADDLMGTLASMAEKQGLRTLVVTGDRDAFQLIDENTQVLYTKRGITEIERYDLGALKDRYGLTPAQFIDMKGLMGAASDNIPGIPGVGEKTALKLLAEHQTLDDVIAARGAYAGKKLGALLEDYQDQARLSKELATIFREIPLEGAIERCKIRREDT